LNGFALPSQYFLFILLKVNIFSSFTFIHIHNRDIPYSYYYQYILLFGYEERGPNCAAIFAPVDEPKWTKWPNGNANGRTAIKSDGRGGEETVDGTVENERKEKMQK
jgi:hypothetical protein